MKKSIRLFAFAALLSLACVLPTGCARPAESPQPMEVSAIEKETPVPDERKAVQESSEPMKKIVAANEQASSQKVEPPLSDTDSRAEGNGSAAAHQQTTPEESAPAQTAAAVTENSTQPAENTPAATKSTHTAAAAEQISSQESTVADTAPAVSETSSAPTVSKVPVEAVSIALSQHTLGMNVGDTVSLTATISPADTDSTRIRWYWSDTSVISINEKAQVTAIGPGTATITVETINGKRDECKVTVYGEGTISPIESPHQTQQLAPAYQPYYPDYDWDAVIADLRAIGEQQYGLVWNDDLWVRQGGHELGGPTGACTIEYPARSAKACYADTSGRPVFDAVSFRQDCLRMFRDLEEDFSKGSMSLAGRPFRIMVEDIGLDDRGVHDYWVYLLYN